MIALRILKFQFSFVVLTKNSAKTMLSLTNQNISLLISFLQLYHVHYVICFGHYTNYEGGIKLFKQFNIIIILMAQLFALSVVSDGV